MSSSSVARRYARALMSLGNEDGQFAAYGEQLSRAATAYENSPELRDLWSNPVYSREERMAAAEKLIQVLQLRPAPANCLRILVERRRGGELNAIANAFGELLDEKLGRVRATVTSARPLSPDQITRLQQALGGRSGKLVSIQTRVAPEIIGGVVAQVGSTLYDASVRTQLERLRQELRSH